MGTTAFGQCETEKYSNTLIEKIPDGFAFLKSYKIDGENGTKTRIEFPYIFSKDSNYFISMANKQPELDGVVLTLYDANRNQVATNKDASTKKFYSGISYKCSSTGVYYLTFSFESTQDFCAAAVLGFKR
jgi:hypothetical protein